MTRAAFLYWLPGLAEARVDAEVLGRFGLREVFRGRGCTAVQCAAGPSGGGGLLVQDSAADDARRAWRPAGQQWVRRLDGLAWLGWWTDSPPGPEDLEREDSMGGHTVLCGDKRRWTFPVARAFPAGTLLPETLIMGPGGLERRVSPEYAGLWATAETVWAALSQPGGLAAIDDAVLWRAAAEALAVNYHLGPDEINALGLITTGTLSQAVLALVDWPALLEWWRSRDPKAPGAGGPAPASPPRETPCGAPGAGDACPATPPPPPTSSGSDARSC